MTRRNEDEVFDGFEVTELQARKKEAKLGYLCMELCDPPAGAKWGEFNDQPVDKKAVKELVLAFHKHVNNCTEGMAIDVVVQAGWLEDEAKLHSSVKGLGIWEVNALTFSEKGKRGIKAETLLMLGGNHCCQAVKRYVKALKKKHEGIEKQQG